MPVSTTNLLQVVNKVLENCGERNVTALGSPLTTLVYNAIVDACHEVSVFSEWTFLKIFLPAQTWTIETAYLGDGIQAIHNVLSGDTATGYKSLVFLQSDAFNTIPLTPTTDTQLYSARYYMVTGFNLVRVNPYPTQTIGQSQILFDVTTTILPPVQPTDLFPVPERFLPLIVAKATELVLVRHIADMNAAKAEGDRFMRMATLIMQRERGTVSGRQNLYKSKRGVYR
jgi:hypothetical protein